MGIQFPIYPQFLWVWTHHVHFRNHILEVHIKDTLIDYLCHMCLSVRIPQFSALRSTIPKFIIVKACALELIIQLLSNTTTWSQIDTFALLVTRPLVLQLPHFRRLTMLHHVSLGHVRGLCTFVCCSIFLLNIKLEEKIFQDHFFIFKHTIALELFPYLRELVDDHNHQDWLT